MSDELVACEFCGFLNPPDNLHCRDCGRRLNPGLRANLSIRARSMDQFSRLVGGVKPSEDEEARPGISRGRLAAVAIGVVVAVVLAAYALHATGYLGGSSSGSSGSRVDLCSSAPGSNCAGTVITLPYTAFGRQLNVSGCDSIVPNGASDHLELTYATTTPMYGVLIPSVLYWGTSVSYYPNPAGFFNTSSAVAEAAWNSGLVAGSHSLDTPVPNSYPQWCLTWWDPGAAGSITFDSDAYLAS